MPEVKCLKCKRLVPEADLLVTGLCLECMRKLEKESNNPLIHYYFTITLGGIGKNLDAAWADAIEGFYQDPGPTPELKETKYEGTA